MHAIFTPAGTALGSAPQVTPGAGVVAVGGQASCGRSSTGAGRTPNPVEAPGAVEEPAVVSSDAGGVGRSSGVP